jgi:hypothetical protein
MLRKSYLIIFAFIPAIVGYLYNFFLIQLLKIPSLITFLFYILPILILSFWFWVGGKFAQRNVKVFPAILIGNSIGIVSLLLYLWQFVFVSSDSRSLYLAGFSQDFSAGLSFFTARFAILFEPEKNVIGQATAIGIQVLGLLFMLIVFTLGYYLKKRKLRVNA